LSRLEDESPVAAALLRLLAWLAPEPVPIALLLADTDVADKLDPDVAAALGPMFGDLIAAGDAKEPASASSRMPRTSVTACSTDPPGACSAATGNRCAVSGTCTAGQGRVQVPGDADQAGDEAVVIAFAVHSPGQPYDRGADAGARCHRAGFGRAG
jgi:hypothetical protein